jgi:uncharacterized protein YndB with AHSA1/START domain
MPNQSLEIKIEIKAPAFKVWRMFTDPDFTRQMGGEYVSDWKVGSSLSWKDLGGNVLTKGIILKIETEKLLKHTLFLKPDSQSVIAQLTYELQEEDGTTTVHIKEEFTHPATDQEYSDSIDGWNAALLATKALVEKL